MATRKDVVGERSNQVEDEYFRRQEQELQERLRERAARETARRDLASAAGVADEAILSTLEDLGFDRDTVAVLHLFPLVVVGWADGEMAEAERRQILLAARGQGVEEGSPADLRLAAWLSHRPTDAYAERAMAVIRHLVEEGGEKVPAGDLVALSRAVAGAAGGFLGLGKVSAAEEEALAKVAALLASEHSDAARKVTG
jgi:hypothetical protein